jgi:hypothetical protein
MGDPQVRRDGLTEVDVGARCPGVQVIRDDQGDEAETDQRRRARRINGVYPRREAADPAVQEARVRKVRSVVATSSAVSSISLSSTS